MKRDEEELIGRAACSALMIVLVASCGVIGCGAPVTVRAHREWLPCSRATRVARDALIRMGYNAETRKPARVGEPGEVSGEKTGRRWTARNRQPGQGAIVRVRIDCSDQGADFEATTDASPLKRLGFDKQFSAAIDAAAQRRVQPPRVKDDATRRGLIVRVEPQPTLGVGEGPAAPPGAVHARAIRFKIENRTARRYRFRRDAIRLVSQEGQRLSALSPAELGTDRGDEQLAGEATIEPNGTLAGVLYFPAATYRRATVVLIDVESDEPEGFSVEF